MASFSVPAYLCAAVFLAVRLQTAIGRTEISLGIAGPLQKPSQFFPVSLITSGRRPCDSLFFFSSHDELKL